MAKEQQKQTNVAVQQPVKANPKGTKGTELILGAAASKLEAGTKSLLDVIKEVAKLDEKINQNILLIADQEGKLEAIAIQLKNDIAQNKIELQQQYDADQKAFVVAWMQENNFQMISKEELDGMKTQIAQAASLLESTVKKEVGAATGILKAQHEGEKKLAEAQFNATQASNTAEIAQLKLQNSFLTQQVNDWKDAADKARQATVDVAKAGGVTQNFSDPNTRK